MTATHLEIVEAATPEKGESFLHAWCTVCQSKAAPAAIPSMCGFKVRPTHETKRMAFWPEDVCVVCNELARRACERCGH